MLETLITFLIALLCGILWQLFRLNEGVQKIVKNLPSEYFATNAFAESTPGVPRGEDARERALVDFWADAIVSMKMLGRIYERVWLGRRYRPPHENSKELKEIESLESLAEQGDPEAQFRLGLAYSDEHLPFRMHDDAAAALRLGDPYFNDYEASREKSYRKAAWWLRKAANQGHSHAQEMLAWLYLNGHGVSQSDVDAFFWYELAVVGTQDAAEAGAIIESRELAASYLSPAELSRVQERARKWLEEHAAPSPER